MPLGASRPTRLRGRALSLGAILWEILGSGPTLQLLLAAALVALGVAGLAPRLGLAVAAGDAPPGPWGHDARGTLGTLLDAVRAAGSAQVLGALIVRGILALLGLVALVHLLNLWAPAWSVPPRWGMARRRAPAPEPEELFRAVADAASAEGLAAMRGGAGAAPPGRLVIRSRGVGPSLAGLTHLGLVTLVFAGLLQWRLGWTGSAHALTLGEPTSLERDTELVARLDELVVAEREAGRPSLLRSVVAVRRVDDTAEPDRLTLFEGHAARYRGYTLRQVGHGPALRVVARDARGDALDVRDLVGDTTPRQTAHVRFSSAQQEQLLLVPAADLLVRSVYYTGLPAAGIERPVVHVQVQRASGGDVLAEEMLTEGGSLNVRDVRLELAMEYYVAVRAERAPGAPVAALGATVLLAGLAAWVARPPRSAWLLAEAVEGTAVVELVSARRNASAPWFGRLAATLGGAGAGAEGPEAGGAGALPGEAGPR